MPLFDEAELARIVEAAAERGARKALESARPAAPGPDTFLAAKDLEQRGLGTASHWRGLARSHAIPTVAVGRHIRFRWSDVEAYLARSPAGASSPPTADQLLARRRGPR